MKLPAWVARHGSKRSAAAVINTVKYVTNVDSCDRRIQSAINLQGKQMQRRAEFLRGLALKVERLGFPHVGQAASSRA